MDKIATDLNAQRTRHHQARYLFGIGATLLLSGTLVLLNRPDWDFFPALLMAAGGLLSGLHRLAQDKLIVCLVQIA